MGFSEKATVFAVVTGLLYSAIYTIKGLRGGIRTANAGWVVANAGAVDGDVDGDTDVDLDDYSSWEECVTGPGGGSYDAHCGALDFNDDADIDLDDFGGFQRVFRLTLCGNGITEPPEECDDGNMTGGDGCRANCTSEECGDGILDPGEECDDGTENSETEPDACRTDCRTASCGDGVLDTGEECDNGPDNSDTEADACRTDCAVASCGDGVGDTGEACDDGNTTGGDGCRANCTLEECGDGIVDPGEECDAGAGNSDAEPDACRTDCTAASCGDGVVDTGEECDAGAGNSDTEPDACRTDCRTAWCGDGVPDTGEECDNGPDNSDTEADACRTDCAGASCGDGVVDTGEECDAGADNSDTEPDACRTDCTAASCGDGVIDNGEECDDSAGNSDTEPDACRTNCRTAWCGDGVLDTGEECDNGPDNSDTEADACRTDCAVASCGDGVLDNGEDCDDGNTFNGDGCRFNCTPEICGDEILDPGEECDPPDGTFCDEQCLYKIVGTLSADDCGDAAAGNSEGYYSLNNFLATLDGPPHTACVNIVNSNEEVGEDQIEHDVWTCWTAPCTSTVVVETCDLATIDTRIAVYEGCACPVTTGRLLACNDDGAECSLQSRAVFEATAGQTYLIRVGTYPSRPGGFGLVKVACGIAGCAGPGDCLTVNETPGCADEACCEAVCTHDPLCCAEEEIWDADCAEEALGFCGSGFSACHSEAGSCTAMDGNGSPGCDDVECCNAVCREDLWCCLVEWDYVCAVKEAAICFSSCGPGAGDCLTDNGTPGCEDVSCCAEVCRRDPYCCQVGWDQECVPLANEWCR